MQYELGLMGGFLLVTIVTSSNGQKLCWYRSLPKRVEPPALFTFLLLYSGELSGYTYFNIVCFLRLWFQLVQPNSLFIQRISGKSGKGWCFGLEK